MGTGGAPPPAPFLKRHALTLTQPSPLEGEGSVTPKLILVGGLAAVTPEGETLGKVRTVQDFGAGDILEIEPGRGGATWYLPFTRECVPEVDVPGGKVVVVRPAEVSAQDPSPSRGEGQG